MSYEESCRAMIKNGDADFIVFFNDGTTTMFGIRACDYPSGEFVDNLEKYGTTKVQGYYIPNCCFEKVGEENDK